MLRDRYDNPLTTTSEEARDAYIDGVDRLLAADGGGEEAFQAAIEADPDFALAHTALARIRQIGANMSGAIVAISRARELSSGASPREQSHIAMLGRLIDGDGPGAYRAALDHLADHPRDALIAQPLTGVFGLIGFSGLAGREAQQLAFMATLAPHYGTDWWFESQHAFAQVEAGQHGRAVDTIERAYAANPRSANAAHIRSHVQYEVGDWQAGLGFIKDWRQDYDRRGALYCHISWHVAQFNLLSGKLEEAWQVVDESIRPGSIWGPPLNVLTDYASFLHRSELAGAPRQPERWREVSEFALKMFPNSGIAFADTHSALAHAIAGESEPLERLIKAPAGVAADLITHLAAAFKAFAAQDWDEAIVELTPVMSSHERIGGSRAQRDLLEFTLATSLLRAGRSDDAHLMLMTRRPIQAAVNPLAAARSV